ncbi:ferric reductase-like transmembrane domain-containing protein [Rhodohalobacter sp.]|uniref:ferredoxin reductase family protein n=1 Tax=Rhodohalobacter sp. TaxID=1974210 RepID=UPI002ACED808|nr:ferric reductase-like transmembrane domain-containing protein [Rhodohalobacter sp.]MDZ7757986.1 ferric reductase-like transmembrane domain-containing protein [Rhodohalobacter sp.]
MEKSDSGSLVFWGVALLVIPLWLISFPETTVRNNLNPFLVYSSQITALTGFSMFALTFVLSARWKWMEDYFGGLDKMYHLHHTMARTALVLLLIHPILLASRFIPGELDKVFWYLLPVHRKVEIDFGSWALWGLILLMLVTIVIKLPYDKWKITHKFMGVFFILGILHIYFLDLSVSANPALAIYLAALSVIGVTAWVYKSVLFDWVIEKPRYRVEKADSLNEEVIEITMTPENERVRFIPGQYFFFSFQDSDLSRESHPFTVCDKSDDGHIKIMVKVLGDYTKQLYRNLKPGAVALLEGPYGRFDYRKGKPKQVWIGGGVGIAPFLSWAHDLEQQEYPDYNIDLYYCVKTESEAIHLRLFKEVEDKMKDFHVHLVREDVEGLLSVHDISGVQAKEIFICGPKTMREALVPQLKKNGVPKAAIHYEDFDFT